jgi:hypothetical protein
MTLSQSGAVLLFRRPDVRARLQVEDVMAAVREKGIARADDIRFGCI